MNKIEKELKYYLNEYEYYKFVEYFRSNNIDSL